MLESEGSGISYSPELRPDVVGARTAVAEAVTGAEAVVTMLPAGKHVASVYDADVFPNAAPGT